jgi:peptidoglycan-N-acetylglucosamine deacetylase
MNSRFQYRIVDPSWVRPFFPWILWRGPGNAVHLTFDDGPDPEMTPKVLDCLFRADVKAVFFVLGQKALLYPGIVERIAREGHTLGNHGFDHRRLNRMPASEAKSQIIRTSDILERITHVRPVLFRPPYGRFDLRFKRWMKETGCRMVMWNLMAYDFNEPDSDRLVNRVESRLAPGSLIVLHDGLRETPLIAALPGILDAIRFRGMKTERLGEII